MNHYQITETEFHRLESAMQQLEFVADLSIRGSESQNFHHIELAGMTSFMDAQRETISQTLKAATERDEQRRAGGRIDHIDIINLVDMLAGKQNHLPPDAASRIMRRLVNEAKDDRIYLSAVESFSDYLVSASTPAPDKAPKRRAATAADMQESVTDGNLSLELFADLMQAVSGQAMTLDELNETVNQFLKAFDEHHPERAVIVQALNAALMHNGYAWVVTCNQDGQQARWVRQEEATAQATTPAPDKTPKRRADKATPATPTEAAGPVVRATKAKSAAASRRAPGHAELTEAGDGAQVATQ